MLSGKTKVVVITVDSDVLLVALLELGDGLVDVLHASLLTHAGSGEVGVETRTVPVTGNGLGVEGDLDTKLLSDTVEEITRDPKVITHCVSVRSCTKLVQSQKTYCQYPRKDQSGTPTGKEGPRR